MKFLLAVSSSKETERLVEGVGAKLVFTGELMGEFSTESSGILSRFLNGSERLMEG
jgi:hypothetical protein